MLFRFVAIIGAVHERRVAAAFDGNHIELPKEAIKVFMPRPQLFIRQKPQFRSIRVPLFCRDPSPSHVTVAKSRFHSSYERGCQEKNTSPSPPGRRGCGDLHPAPPHPMKEDVKKKILPPPLRGDVG